MCASYTLKPDPRVLSAADKEFSIPDYPCATDRVLPSRMAPVIAKGVCKVMRFSLVPSWAKESKVKFATHNARIETVLEKPTWRKPFEKNHCLIPMNAFIEPIYEGEYAGHMVKFVAPSTIFAAGIFDEWVNPETGEVLESFSILTKDPSDFVLKTGHDRQPIFLLDKNDQKDWISSSTRKPQDWQSFLATVNNANQFTVEIDRKLKVK